MLKKVILIATLFVGTVSYSQWTSQTSGTTNDLRAVTFPSATVGYAAGFGGTILKTNNGGTTWTTLASGVVQDLYSVLFVNETTGFVFGDGGRIVKTTDGGLTWTVKVSGTTNSLLTSYLMNDNTTIFAAGASGTIRKSTDAGETWTSVTSGTTEDINSITFDEATNMTGYFVGNNAVISYIYKSTDAGATWAAQTLPANNVNSFFSISAVDANNVFFCGGVSKILKTTNGGTQWTNVNNSSANFYRSCLFSSATAGFVVGGNGKIITTSNAGTSYTTETSGTTEILNSITMTSCGSYFVVGNMGTILKKGGSVSGLADNYTTNQASPLVIPAGSGVLANDNQSGVTVAISSNASNGTVVLNTDGAFVYTPNAGFTGNDQFSYVITDGCGNSSNPILVNINSTASLNSLEEGGIKIYPTVASDILNINYSEPISSVFVYNNQGKEVLHAKAFSGNELNVQHLENALYTIKIVDANNKEFWSKFLIIK